MMNWRHHLTSLLGVALCFFLNFLQPGNLASGFPSVRIHPAQDVTLFDGGIAGPFDGIAEKGRSTPASMKPELAAG